MTKQRKGFDFSKLADYRKKQGLNQSRFWSRFGVTQSGGCRYETGRRAPTSVAALIWLLDAGKITEEGLAEAIKAVKGR